MRKIFFLRNRTGPKLSWSCSPNLGAQFLTAGAPLQICRKCYVLTSETIPRLTILKENSTIFFLVVGLFLLFTNITCMLAGGAPAPRPSVCDAPRREASQPLPSPTPCTGNQPWTINMNIDITLLYGFKQYTVNTGILVLLKKAGFSR